MSYDFSKFIEMAKELGAAESKVIDAKTIKTAPFVAMKCKYGCDRYNTSLCCPPYTPSYKETAEVIKSYKNSTPDKMQI
jgi:predicted metal-binding protein